MGGGGWAIFQNVYSGGTWKLPVQKIVTTNLKQKRKESDSDCNFYNLSLLVPNPNKFLAACIYTLIFHGIYSP